MVNYLWFMRISAKENAKSIRCRNCCSSICTFSSNRAICFLYWFTRKTTNRFPLSTEGCLSFSVTITGTLILNSQLWGSLSVKEYWFANLRTIVLAISNSRFCPRSSFTVFTEGRLERSSWERVNTAIFVYQLRSRRNEHFAQIKIFLASCCKHATGFTKLFAFGW